MSEGQYHCYQGHPQGNTTALGPVPEGAPRRMDRGKRTQCGTGRKKKKDTVLNIFNELNNVNALRGGNHSPLHVRRLFASTSCIKII